MARTEPHKRIVKPGDVVMVELPWSEVCMYMGVAGKVRRVQVRSNGAQILHESGTPFSMPISHGEAGIYTPIDGDWYTYVAVVGDG